jgi:hypothetical protein
MLDKRGSSNSKERIELVNKFIRLFGKDAIGPIVADREFVGKQWLEFLEVPLTEIGLGITSVSAITLKYFFRIRTKKLGLPICLIDLELMGLSITTKSYALMDSYVTCLDANSIAAIQTKIS